ncbi:sensor domain-containing diguanylate cyclase [Veronia nyctiphanis]|uniref:sensor domain-containing diguanylate cyclase n=1 Tax=Veronia nyctiphanis TaxID=1278244 RepID=UPI00137613A8|nr:sensor domain-containing diguanylate cyclase [Veronia nyctiphanis]
MSRNLTVNQLLFLTHLLLVLILIAGFSVTRYQSEWSTRLNNEVVLAEQIIAPLVLESSTAVAGRNYAALTLPSQKQTLLNIEPLLLLDVTGVSDYSSQSVSVRYQRDIADIWRMDVSTDEINQTRKQRNDLGSALTTTTQQSDAQRKKITYLVKKLDGELKTIERAKLMSKTVALPWLLPAGDYSYKFLPDEKVLVVQTPLVNKNGGTLKAVFDASTLYHLKTQIVKTLFLEAAIALLASVLLIIVVSNSIVSPLKRLANKISQDIEKLDISDMKELKRQDEIGILARALQSLTEKTQSQMKLLRHLSDTDALTGMSGRHKYEDKAEVLFRTSQSKQQNFGIIICDIDSFKLYNDTFGHSKGDEVIKKIAGVLLAVTRNNDLCFRIGGEEFIILFTDKDANNVHSIAERMRKEVQRLAIPHHTESGIVTLSLGAVLATQASGHWSYQNIFDHADEQLYKAKGKGRNCTVFSEIDASMAPTRNVNHADNAIKFMD